MRNARDQKQASQCRVANRQRVVLKRCMATGAKGDVTSRMGRNVRQQTCMAKRETWYFGNVKSSVGCPIFHINLTPWGCLASINGALWVFIDGFRFLCKTNTVCSKLTGLLWNGNVWNARVCCAKCRDRSRGREGGAGAMGLGLGQRIKHKSKVGL